MTGHTVESITPGLRYMLGRRARKDIPLAIDGPVRSYPNQFGPVVVPRKVKMVWTSPQVSATAQFSPAIQIGKRWRVSVPRLERYLHGVDQSS